jgi:hypothetical protein
MSDPTRGAGARNSDADEPRLRIVHTEEAWKALLKAVLEAPVATGEGAEMSEAAITGDRFRDNHCVRCWDRGALYCFEENYVSLCSRCTIERIERLAGVGRELPPSVLWLHWEAEKELRAQAKREREKLSIVFDDMCRCARCTALIQTKDARYWIPEGGNSSPPYCKECREILASGEDVPTDARQTEFDFDV